MTPEQSEKIYTWRIAQQQAKAASENEIKLRREIVREMFTADKVEGTETIELINGWGLKAEKKLNYKVANGEEMDAFETFIDKLKGGPELYEQLFRWKAELSVKTFKAQFEFFRNLITEKQRIAFDKLFADVLIITPGTPSLEIIEPKAK